MPKLYPLSFILTIVLSGAAAARAQAPHAFPFRASNYDVEVILRPGHSHLGGFADVDEILGLIRSFL